MQSNYVFIFEPLFCKFVLIGQMLFLKIWSIVILRFKNFFIIHMLEKHFDDLKKLKHIKKV